MNAEPEIDLVAVLGTTLSRTFTLRNAGVPVDLTGWVPSLSIMREHGGSVLQQLTPASGLTIPNPTDGRIVLAPFCGGVGWNLAVGRYRYRMVLTASPTNVWPLWVGMFDVVPN